jgi:hypothetical protein
MYLSATISTPRFRPMQPHLRRHVAVRNKLGQIQQVETSVLPTAAGAAATYGATTGLVAAGAAAGSVVPIVGTIVGAAVSALIGGLLSGHFAREKGAQTENAQLNQVIPAVISDLTSIVNAANSGTITPQEAITAVEAVRSNYWQAVAQYETGPGQAGGPNLCPFPGPMYTVDSQAPGIVCSGSKTCTASCCIGCTAIQHWCFRLEQMFQAGYDIVRQQGGVGGKGGGTNGWDNIVGNKYGLQSFTCPNWQYSPSGSGSAALASLTSATVPVIGIPWWMVAVGGLGIWFFFFR